MPPKMRLPTASVSRLQPASDGITASYRPSKSMSDTYRDTTCDNTDATSMEMNIALVIYAMNRSRTFWVMPPALAAI